jgi:peptide chain release factor 1
MIEKLESIIAEYKMYQDQLYDPETFSDMDKVRSVNKKLKSLEKVHELSAKYMSMHRDVAQAKEMLVGETDSDMIEFAKSEITSNQKAMEALEEELKVELLPKDPNDEKDAFLEVRPAAGGDEAGLFASELLRGYMLFAAAQGRKTEIIDEQLSDIWWVKLVVVKIEWDNVYSKLKRESGVHRVQRIPATESQWRVHTSTVTVAIMPEIDDVQVHIDPNDIEMDTYAASSAGGQNANKNQTWVRLHHKPTWLMVNIWETKSQLKNKERAFAVLRSRIYQIEQDKQIAEVKELRGAQIGTWGRSEKIRTYNFPQDRITDHRIKKSRPNIPWVLNGQMWTIMDDMTIASREWFADVGTDDDD